MTLPSGTVTFLFTDIEGSTRRWQDEPDAMRALLVDHDAILREVIDKHHGHLFKHTGDGVAAAFGSASDAVAAAIDAQERLREVLPVRMGLHTGEAELRDGDYFGSTLNRCARLMSIGHGGQIVCSDATAGLVRDRDDLRDLGEHRLRDLSRAERVWQVAGAEFAALRSLDTARTNLPLQLSSFVGREGELAGLASALDAARLVTVIGVGGVGKTRLAMQAAADAIVRFPDGVWLCELASAVDDETLLQVIATVLGVRPRSGVTLEASIVESLRARRLLVVLDNCEHLIRRVAAFAAAVLRDCPTARLLATSREALGVSGEQVWPLTSLELPDAAALDAALANESVRLFGERAMAARPAFRVGPANVDAVVEICRRLDGIPLAIELAAARVAALTPTDIASLLDERFRLLTGGRRTQVERHQTLRATVDWSYSLLTDNERVVFDRLGVFIGSFDAVGARAVCAADGVEVWDVLEALTGLVAKSMVIAEETAEGTMRYQLLETLRQYSRERLDDSGQTDRWRRRHAAHFADRAEEQLAGVDGPDEYRWRSRLDRDLDNIRAAVIWSLDRDEPTEVDYGLRIVAAICRSSRPRHLHADWVDRVLPLLAGRPAPLQGLILGGAAINLAQIEGDFGRALQLAQAALETETPEGTITGNAALVLVATHHGDLEEALRRALEARAAARTSDVGPLERAGYTLVPIYAALVGQHDLAVQSAEEALDIARHLGPTALCSALYAAAQAFARAGDPARALKYFEESATLASQGADHPSLGINYAFAARLRDEQGNLTGALRALEQGLETFRRAGPRPDIVHLLAQICRTFARNNHAHAAAVLDGILSAGPVASYAAIGTPDRLAVATAPARAQLGDAPYLESLARGAAMNYGEAIDFARTELASAIAETTISND